MFAGAQTGLVLAEIECANDATLRAVQGPEWVIREVTPDVRFQGGALAGIDENGATELLA